MQQKKWCRKKISKDKERKTLNKTQAGKVRHAQAELSKE